MKKIFGFILVVCCCALYAFGNGYGSVQQVTQNKESYVYICTGGYATKYHRYSKCKGLGNCKGEIKKVTESAAIKQGRTRCKICY